MRDQVSFSETQVIMENTYLMGSKKYHFLGPSVFKFKEPNNEINYLLLSLPNSLEHK